MNRTWQIFCWVGILLAFAGQLLATNSPAPAKVADTNFVDPAILEDNPQAKQLAELMKRQGIKPEAMLDQEFLLASLFWGSVGGGYLLYARKQREIPPFIGGVAMLAVSFLITSWVLMSLVCLALMVGVWQMMRRSD